MILDYFLVLVLTVLAGGWSIPAGIQFGLNPLGVYIAAVLGSIGFTTAALLLGGRARDWVSKKVSPKDVDKVDTGKASALLDRWGLPGFAIIGGTILGPTVTVSAAVVLGVDRHRFLAWYLVGTVVGFGLLTLFWAVVT